MKKKILKLIATVLSLAIINTSGTFLKTPPEAVYSGQRTESISSCHVYDNNPLPVEEQDGYRN